VTVNFRNSTNNFTYIGVAVEERPLPVPRKLALRLFSSNTGNVIYVSKMFDFFADIKEVNTWWRKYQSEEDAIAELYDISWSCSYEETDDGDKKNCTSLIEGQMIANGLRIIWEHWDMDKFGSHNYTFTAILSTKNRYRSVSNSLKIAVVEEKYPEVEISPTNIYLNDGDQAVFEVFVTPSGESEALSGADILEEYTLEWEILDCAICNESNSFVTSLGRSVFDTSQTSILPSQKVRFSLWVYALDETESPIAIEASAILNSPPRYGSCSLDNNEGIPFETVFTMTCEGWESASGTSLEYQFEQMQTGSRGRSPLITYSRGPSLSFSLGPGTFMIFVKIKDMFNAVTEVSQFCSVLYSEAKLNNITSDSAGYIAEVSEEHSLEVKRAAQSGDLTKTIQVVSNLNSAIYTALGGDIGVNTRRRLALENSRLSVSRRRLNSQDGLTEAISLREKLFEAVKLLIEKTTGTQKSLKSLVNVLWTQTVDPSQVSTTAVSNGSVILKSLTSGLTSLMAEEAVSKFESELVSIMMESSIDMILVAMDGRDAAVVQSLWNSGMQSLRQSLTDTLPGQTGYVNRDQSYGKSTANRVEPSSIFDCSNDFVSFGHVIQTDDMSSVDCTIRTDDFDISSWLAGSERRRSEVIGYEEIVTVNLYDSTYQASGGLYDETASAINVSLLEDCEPVIVRIKTTIFNGMDYNTIISQNNGSGKQTWEVPLCLALEYGYSTNWSDNGCALISWDDTSAYCACRHLSSFTTSVSDYIPSIELFKDAMRADITWESLWQNPITPICTITIMALLFRLLPEFRYHCSDYHPLAHKRIWSDQKWNLVKHSSYFNYLKAKSGKSLFSRCWKIYLWQFRNEHPVFGLCFRDTATNYTGHQRFLSVMASLAAALAVQAVFYGQTFETPYQETATQGMLSIFCAIIPSLGKKIFKTHQTSEKNYGKVRIWNEGLSKLRTFCRCMCCCRKLERQATVPEGFQKTFSKTLIGSEITKIGSAVSLVSKHMRRKNSAEMYGFNISLSDFDDLENSAEGKQDHSLSKEDNIETEQDVCVIERSIVIPDVGHSDTSKSDMTDLTPKPVQSSKKVDTVTHGNTATQTLATMDTEASGLASTLEAPKMGKAVIRRRLSKDSSRSKLIKPQSLSETPISEGKSDCTGPVGCSTTEGIALSYFDVDGGLSPDLKSMRTRETPPLEISRSVLTVEPKVELSEILAAPTPHKTTPPKPQPLAKESFITSDSLFSKLNDKTVDDLLQQRPISASTIHSKKPPIVEISSDHLSPMGFKKSEPKSLSQLELQTLGESEEVCTETSEKNGKDESNLDVCGNEIPSEILPLSQPSTLGISSTFGPGASQERWETITISNRMRLLLDNERGLRNRIHISQKQQELLKELQRIYLRKSFKFPNCCKIFAFNLLITWCLICGICIILFGINFDIRAQMSVTDEILNSVHSNCSNTRIFESATLEVDIPLSSLMDLNFSQFDADAWNLEYTPYPASDYNVFPDYLRESYRFLWGAALSWLMGIFVISIVQEILIAIILSFIFCHERERLFAIITNETFKRKPHLIHYRRGTFLLLLHPSALIQMEQTVQDGDEDEIKMESYRDQCNDYVEGLINFCMDG